MSAKTNLLPVNVNGNKKLVNTETVRFLIWNLPAVVTCPYATEHCKKACYALKAEKMYKTCRAARQTNFELSLKDDFVVRMIETISYYRNSKAYAGKKMIVRIHESGDFYNQAYADKWISIIKNFENDDTIVFYAYTKSIPFFRKYDIKSFKNFSFISSIWDDTPIELVKETNEKHYRVYTAVESFDNWSGNRCRCADCAKCQQCINNNVNAIACLIH